MRRTVQVTTRITARSLPRAGQGGEGLDALLPLRYTELQNAAADVPKSEQFVDSFANRRGNLTDGLNAL